jgi:hypothetical protein
MDPDPNSESRIEHPDLLQYRTGTHFKTIFFNGDKHVHCSLQVGAGSESGAAINLPPGAESIIQDLKRSGTCKLCQRLRTPGARWQYC